MQGRKDSEIKDACNKCPQRDPGNFLLSRKESPNWKLPPGYLLPENDPQKTYSMGQAVCKRLWGGSETSLKLTNVLRRKESVSDACW